MSSVHCLLPVAFIVLLTCLSFKATTAQSTINECGPYLLSVMPCASFVQGTAGSPAPACCSGVKQLYAQKPTCLCLLFNETAISSLTSLPINTTLALELPDLCDLQVDPTICPGTTTSLPSVPPPAQVSFDTTPKPTLAASPVVTVEPRPSIMGFPLRSGEEKSKAGGQLLVKLLLVAIFSVLNLLTS